MIAKHALVGRDFAMPRDLDAGREPFAASLREKAAVLRLRVVGDMSFDMVHDYGGLPRGQRRAVARDGCRVSGRDRRRQRRVPVSYAGAGGAVASSAARPG